MAALTGNLAARQRRQLQALRDTQEETSELLDLSRKLTAATDRQAVVSAAAQHLNGWSDCNFACSIATVRAAGKSRPAGRWSFPKPNAHWHGCAINRESPRRSSVRARQRSSPDR